MEGDHEDDDVEEIETDEQGQGMVNLTLGFTNFLLVLLEPIHCLHSLCIINR